MPLLLVMKLVLSSKNFDWSTLSKLVIILKTWMLSPCNLIFPNKNKFRRFRCSSKSYIHNLGFSFVDWRCNICSNSVSFSSLEDQNYTTYSVWSLANELYNDKKKKKTFPVSCTQSSLLWARASCRRFPSQNHTVLFIWSHWLRWRQDLFLRSLLSVV